MPQDNNITVIYIIQYFQELQELADVIVGSDCYHQVSTCIYVRTCMRTCVHIMCIYVCMFYYRIVLTHVLHK